MVEPLRETVWQVLEKLSTELPYHAGIPLLDVYPEELKHGIRGEVCTPMLILALFTIAKRQKQPKCPLMHDQINKMWHTYTRDYYSGIERNEVWIHWISWLNLKTLY